MGAIDWSKPPRFRGPDDVAAWCLEQCIGWLPGLIEFGLSADATVVSVDAGRLARALDAPFMLEEPVCTVGVLSLPDAPMPISVSLATSIVAWFSTTACAPPVDVVVVRERQWWSLRDVLAGAVDERLASGGPTREYRH
jgi:hypothetical protein